MRISRLGNQRILAVACVLALVLASAAMASEPIKKGVDVWMTVAGRAQTSFADEPIPAGFFCDDSLPFSGTVVMQGVPLAVAPRTELGGIDTVVRRLDDAVFNDKGEASTRVQLMALSLASVKPVETSCGKYDVTVSLAPGKQPVTTMRIFLESSLGGTYSAPLALNVRLVFTPVGGDKRGAREVMRRIDLGPAIHSAWAYVTTPRYAAGTKVDTLGSGRPDTLLPAPSNFQAGISSAVLKADPAKPLFVQMLGCPTACPDPGQPVPPDVSCPCGQCPWWVCHCTLGSTDIHQSSDGCTSEHLHCTWVCYTP